MSDSGQKKSGNSKLLIVAGVLLGMIAGVAGGIWFYAKKQNHANAPVVVSLKVLHLEPFVVNIGDPSSGAFLRLGVDLGVELQEDEGEAKGELDTGRMSQMRDTVIGVITSLRPEDLLTAEGKSQVKKRLVTELQARIPELKVRDVYFTELLVQR